MNYSLRIPDYYKEELENLKGNTSMNQFIVNAIAEKISALKTVSELEKRAKKGSREHALKILRNAPDVEAKEDN
ncbi:hypothetical protein GCM10012288_13030 [Malaciobacter pacificus]|uniref:Uncharacterized protein n=1 Tax=Malaciobacter pacificus TaxID=1080223 RepID=A0A5C2H508_9BACT|nr:CopG family transcriptional regulator [Malaciobacter pacificus]QEP34090.1 hypothetical protein APAC_0962 [Malaciobacter pacificus]GGD40340.1 hypothetical protein GCM10012288_13030 [Malaciobacter pacificus]